MPTWMQSGGYNTYFSGKFLVSYGLTDAKPEGQKTNQPRGFLIFLTIDGMYLMLPFSHLLSTI
jgi:hypothetical protein